MESKAVVAIHKNPNGDTRTAPEKVSFEQFQEANDQHISDVARVMKAISHCLKANGRKHDFTKIMDGEGFYRDFLATKNDGADFESSEWYQFHINTERHHLWARCPEDVNLLDVIEMIVDCVCAGKTRSGQVRDIEISPEILEKAFKNTVEMVDDMTVVIE